MDPLLSFFLTIPGGAIFLRVFMVVFAILYVLYSFLILGQTSTLRKTVITEHGDLIQFVSTAQLVVALAVLVISLIY